MEPSNKKNFCKKCDQNFAVHNDDGSCVDDDPTLIYNHDGTKLKCSKCGGYDFLVDKKETLTVVVEGPINDPLELTVADDSHEETVSHFRCVDCGREIENEDWLERQVALKEKIAAIIFDYEGADATYVRPTEEDCHKLAEEILDAHL